MRRQSVGSRTTSKADYLVCPGCGCGQLRPRGLPSRMAECDFCKCAFDDPLVRTLKQVVALPEPPSRSLGLWYAWGAPRNAFATPL